MIQMNKYKLVFNGLIHEFTASYDEIAYAKTDELLSKRLNKTYTLIKIQNYILFKRHKIISYHWITEHQEPIKQEDLTKC